MVAWLSGMEHRFTVGIIHLPDLGSTPIEVMLLSTCITRLMTILPLQP